MTTKKKGDPVASYRELQVKCYLEFENYEVVIERLGDINSQGSQEFLCRLTICESK